MPWFDDTIVVDTGSTDRTAIVAAECGAKIRTAVMNYGFAAARNAGLDAVVTEWFFVLDADEWPTLELLAQIKIFVQDSRSHQYESGILWRENKVGECEPVLEKHTRLFKAHMRYQGRVHEAIPVGWPGVEFPKEALLLHHKSWERQKAQDKLYAEMYKDEAVCSTTF